MENRAVETYLICVGKSGGGSPGDSWFASRGVSEADFDEAMLKMIAPINAFADKVLCYLTVTL